MPRRTLRATGGVILRVSPDGKKAERIATGIRSVYGLGFNEYGDLFFTDNEGGGNPTEELNKLVINGYYGHNPLKYGADTVTGPVHSLQTEAAPAGIEFNASHNNFGGTAGDLFIAFYGPGEFWTRSGIGRVSIRRQPDGNYTYEIMKKLITGTISFTKMRGDFINLHMIHPLLPFP